MGCQWGRAIFDAHLHIIDPRFPLEANQGYLPETFRAADYLRRARSLGIVGGAVVSGSFHGFDQRHLTAALRQLGPAYVGICQLPADANPQHIADLDAAGVRALRFNLRRGGQQDWSAIERLARLAFDCAGWHAEFYLDAPTLLALEPRLAALPAIVIDHLGLQCAALPALLRLIEGGARVKASGFGRLDFDPAAAMAAIAAAHPAALVFGTDLPSTRAARPFADADLGLLCDALADQALIKAALLDNAVALYRMPAQRANEDPAEPAVLIGKGDSEHILGCN